MQINFLLPFRWIKFVVLLNIPLLCWSLTTQAATDCNAVTEIPVSECHTLLEFYRSTHGPDWDNNTGWDQTNEPCSWFSITCEAGHVIKIGFEPYQGWFAPLYGGNGLTGQIPDLDLPYLQQLYLKDNFLSGAVPNFSQLPNLTVLDLSNNQFSGEIPNFSHLPLLEKLFLPKNQLTGHIPDFKDLLNLTLLDLSFNQLSGEIPSLSHFSNLKQLYLASNQLSGIIPNFSGIGSGFDEDGQLFYFGSSVSLGDNCGLTAYDDAQATLLDRITPPSLYDTTQVTACPPLVTECVIDSPTVGEWRNQNQNCFTQITDCTTVTEIPLTECQALLEFYHSTMGPNWANDHGWNRTNLPCSWFGVTCREGHVTEILFKNNNLSGQLPDLDLPYLTVLTLANNGVGGTIPDFSHLPSLTELILEGNRFRSRIPDFNLPNLTTLHLGPTIFGDPSSSFSGNLPDFSHLPNLTTLYISGGRNLTGSIPNFSNLPNLTTLSLHDNRLQGEIPDFSNLPNLTTLSLHDNGLQGEIPDFSNLPNLTRLSLSQNSLSGNIPNFSHLPKLTSLNIAYNTLSGNLPDFNNVPNLTLLDLSWTSLTGPIPNFNLPKLTSLNLHFSQLSGEIPNFSYLSSLKLLDLSSNQLSGTIPNFTAFNLADLESVSFHGNCGLTAYDEAQATVINNKDYQGLTPGWNCPKTTVTDCNEVTEIPIAECQVLLEFYHSTNGTFWDFGTNWNQTNSPCSWLGVTCYEGHVTGIILSNRSLHGQIPDLNLPYLTTLDLERTELSGPLPDFSHLPNLEVLGLRSNYQLSGPIPDFSNLPNLIALALRENLLEGNIPDFSHLPNLRVLRLDSNQLSGPIPDFNNLPNLAVLDLAINRLSGEIPDFHYLPNLGSLDLRWNQLSGPIPDFSNLSNLTALDLEWNQLSGTVPNFSHLPNLTALWLSNNCRLMAPQNEAPEIVLNSDWGFKKPACGFTALDSKGQQMTTTALFTEGGATVDKTYYRTFLSIPANSTFSIQGHITVDPVDVGKQADLFYVVGFEKVEPFIRDSDTTYTIISETGELYDIDLYSEFSVWMAQLVEKPFKRNVTLQSEMVITDTKEWQLTDIPSVNYYFIGYLLLEEGTLVYKEVPITVRTP